MAAPQTGTVALRFDWQGPHNWDDRLEVAAVDLRIPNQAMMMYVGIGSSLHANKPFSFTPFPSLRPLPDPILLHMTIEKIRRLTLEARIFSYMNIGSETEGEFAHMSSLQPVRTIPLTLPEELEPGAAYTLLVRSPANYEGPFSASLVRSNYGEQRR